MSTDQSVTSSKLPRRCALPGKSDGFTRIHFKRTIPQDILAQLHELRKVDNWHNIFSIGYDWLLIALSIAASLFSHMNLFIYIIAVLIIGSRQRALLNLVHQASHRRLFLHRDLNDWVGRLLIAFPIMSSLSAYMCDHCIHHGYLWKMGVDPKMERYGKFGLLNLPDDLKSFILKHLLRPLLLFYLPYNLRSAVWSQGEKRSETIARYTFWVAFLTIMTIAGVLPLFLLFWIVPYCTSYQIVRYLADMTDHAGLRTFNPWMGTRTWQGFWLLRMLIAPHNDNYHLTHHLFPAIPHYKWPVAHQLLLQVPEYANAHHCYGFFWPSRPGASSVIQDVLHPERISARTQGLVSASVVEEGV